MITSIWGIPLSVYLIRYRILLKKRYRKLPLLPNLEEEETDEEDKYNSGRINYEKYYAQAGVNVNADRNEISTIGTSSSAGKNKEKENQKLLGDDNDSFGIEDISFSFLFPS